MSYPWVKTYYKGRKQNQALRYHFSHSSSFVLFFFFIKEENKTKNFTTILVILQVLTSPSSHPGIIYFTFQSSQAVTSSEFLATINGRDRM